MKEALAKVWEALVYLFKMSLSMIFALLESGFCISSEYFGKMCVKFKPCDEAVVDSVYGVSEDELPEVEEKTE